MNAIGTNRIRLYVTWKERTEKIKLIMERVWHHSSSLWRSSRSKVKEVVLLCARTSEKHLLAKKKKKKSISVLECYQSLKCHNVAIFSPLLQWGSPHFSGKQHYEEILWHWKDKHSTDENGEKNKDDKLPVSQHWGHFVIYFVREFHNAFWDGIKCLPSVLL